MHEVLLFNSEYLIRVQGPKANAVQNNETALKLIDGFRMTSDVTCLETYSIKIYIFKKNMRCIVVKRE